ncbi:MAG: molybdopterin molybdotransferase MoeA [Chloroflexi bacterium]|nr:molybdopterin molybdotransferase MoeA [Ardenticatenaceae bacterium]MBL1127393.1 molybdopterin molybdenumtransferase MoeA [Chloroflexota bacterium]NOG33455.1 molybdopterin molybdotransferase MoeA [Chloroflexota bacterium]GIK58533.1 MAG: molybdopterin molybdenumtransferase MoeA [Chloroflexota bacterium]
MPEFFNVLPPDEARVLLLAQITAVLPPETVATEDALGRVTAVTITAPHPLPPFRRSTMDGYAVRAADTYGASESLPAFLHVIGEIPMGQPANISLQTGQAALVHTGGMIPDTANAVVQVEHTQMVGYRSSVIGNALAVRGEQPAVSSKQSTTGSPQLPNYPITQLPTLPFEIEVFKAVAVGQNVLQVGEDVTQDAEILPAGHWLRPQDVGGLLALGIMQVAVARRPCVGILATGDEIIPPEQAAGPGQIRDINSYTVAGMVRQAGGIPVLGGIIADDFDALYTAAANLLATGDMLVLSAGSSVSIRDMTVQVIEKLGQPGVLLHGVATRPGKPTIVGAVAGKPVLGLPGNPVSAMIQFDMFGVPAIYRLQGVKELPRQGVVWARLSQNIASESGREDYVPARLEDGPEGLVATPVFGKSNLIYTLVNADGLIKVPLNKNGLQAGEWVHVRIF